MQKASMKSNIKEVKQIQASIERKETQPTPAGINTFVTSSRWI